MREKTRGYGSWRTAGQKIKLNVSEIGEGQKPWRYAMDAFDAGRWDRLVRGFWRQGLLSSTDLGILTTMLWEMRSKGSDRCEASYHQVHLKTGRGSSSAVQALQRACGLGLMRKIKSRVWCAVGAFVRKVNGKNSYIFQIPEQKTELEMELEAAENVSCSAQPSTALKANKSTNKQPTIDPQSPIEKALGSFANAKRIPWNTPIRYLAPQDGTEPAPA